MPASDRSLLARVSPYWVRFLTHEADVLAPAGASFGPAWLAEIEGALTALNADPKGADVLPRFDRALATANGADRSGLTHYLLATALRRVGRVDEALPLFERNRQKHPHHAYYAAACHLQLGHPEAAVEALEAAVAANPEFGRGWAALALITGLARDYDKSQRAAERAWHLGSDIGDALVPLLLFQAQHMRGEPEAEIDFVRPTPERLRGDRIDELLARLPAVEPRYRSSKSDAGKAVVYVSTDTLYFHRYTVPLVLSLIEQGSKVIAHVHVVNPDSAVLGSVRRLDQLPGDVSVDLTVETVPIEEVCHPALYFSCVRFCRLHQELERRRQPILIVDGDTLFRQPADLIFAENASVDYALLSMEAEPIWHRIAAGANLFNPNESALAFTRTAASYILENVFGDKGRWFLDQIALYLAWEHHRDRHHVGTLSPALHSDLAHGGESRLWTVTLDKSPASAFARQSEALRRRFFGDQAEPFNAVCETKYGSMIYNRFDEYIGSALATLGSWCDHEVQLLRRFVRDGGVAVDAGANYGAHTLALARMVGPKGRVYAFEPQRLVYQALCGTMALNSLIQVRCFHGALGAARGEIKVPALDFGATNNFGGLSLCGPAKVSAGADEIVDVRRIDDLGLDRCDVIKVDVEGMELEVVQGARTTIEKHRPVLYLENHDDERRAPLIALCRSLSYELYWHGTSADPNMLCVPRESALARPPELRAVA